LLSWSLGVSSLSWYCWDLSNTLVGKPPAKAWQQTHDWMVGATMTTACASSGSVWSCGMTQSNGTAALALWDTSKTCSNGACTTSAHAVPTQFGHYQDLMGITHTISGHSVPLGIKPLLLVP
jgi:hypothetical protein